MIDNDKISNTQLWMFIALTTIGIGFFSLPRTVGEIVNTDAWFATILGGLFALIDYYIMCKLVRKFPGCTLVEMSYKIVGKFLSIPLLLVFWLYLLLVVSSILRVFGEVIKMTLLTRTPIEIILISMLILVLILIRSGIESIVRFDQLVFWLLFTTSALGVIFALADVDFSGILPFMRTPPKDLLLGSYQTTYSYAGFELILLIIPFVKEPNKAFKTGITAFSIVIGTYVAAVILSFGYFGLAQIKQLLWPTMAVIRTIEVPGSFIENLEGIVITQWILFSYTSLIAYHYAVSHMTARILRKSEFKYFCTIFTPVIYIIAMMPDNIIAVYKFLDKMMLYIGSASIIGIPVLLYIVSSIRKMGVRQNA